MEKGLMRRSKPGIHKLVNVLRWFYWGPARKALSQLSPEYLFQAQKIIGFFAYSVFRGIRNYLTGELKKSFGGEWTEEKIAKSVRSSFDIYAGTQLRMSGLDRLNNSNIDKSITISGIGYLDKGLEERKGVIILNPHFGPFMSIMPALGHRGYKVSQFALQGEAPWGARKGMEKKIYDFKVKCIEGNMPVKFINAARGAFTLREAIQALKNNEIVLYPSTGRGGSAFHAASIMRRKSLFSLTPFNLALKTGAALIPAFVICEGKTTIVRFEKSIAVEPGATAESLIEKYAKVLESYIEKFPGHFLMYLYEVHLNTKFGEAPFFIE